MNARIGHVNAWIGHVNAEIVACERVERITLETVTQVVGRCIPVPLKRSSGINGATDDEPDERDFADALGAGAERA